MQQHGRMLIVIADGEHARFIRPAADHALHEERAIESHAAHQQSSDLRSDHPGASFHSRSSTHHAMTPRHDPKELEKDRFAKLVAAEVNAAAQASSFDTCLLVAPAHCLAALQAALIPEAARRVVGKLAKDLTKTPTQDLAEHLREWVTPVHRPAGSARFCSTIRAN